MVEEREMSSVLSTLFFLFFRFLLSLRQTECESFIVMSNSVIPPVVQVDEIEEWRRKEKNEGSRTNFLRVEADRDLLIEISYSLSLSLSLSQTCESTIFTDPTSSSFPSSFNLFAIRLSSATKLDQRRIEQKKGTKKDVGILTNQTPRDANCVLISLFSSFSLSRPLSSSSISSAREKQKKNETKFRVRKKIFRRKIYARFPSLFSVVTGHLIRTDSWDQ